MAVPIIVVQIAMARAGPILKGRVVETLRARFGSDVQLDTLQVTIAHGVDVSGDGLRIFPLPEVMAAGYRTPLIAVGHFEFHATLSGLIFRPTHVGTVRVRGLHINMPPADVRAKAGSRPHRLGKIKIRVDEIVCDASELVIGTDKPDKDPRVFELKHVVLRDLGPGNAWPYDAVLTNPVPRGEIHAAGTFGPWNMDDPGDSNVSGQYSFEHADMNTIKGLGGILNSTGSFNGQLDRIAVHGKTEVPNFSLDTANHPMPLLTEFRATVDGTSGDTYLEHIDAKLGGSQFTCSGAVVNIKGRGHAIHVTADVEQGNIGDFLQLAIKTLPPAMSGLISLTTSLDIDPGGESVTRKLNMKGEFSLREIHFTDAEVEDKVDILSLRARGETDNLKSGAPDVQSRLVADFSMRRGELTFPHLEYWLPGGDVKLSGTYRLEGRICDFAGDVRTKAEVSNMIASKWKRILLKPIDPFFRKHGWGAVIPVHVSGRNGKVKVGLRF
ncbi:MAG TPA: AsmA-like C-terminal region-containing protein [Terracidiphilus sp.]